ncbi:hypothetical protein [Alkalihalobacillus sp. AL-G]|uniref:hypothetical protein n=1 Tax=Alkalihalobacillus sp. AL-G TaxID=2926399 RepID=UPI00272DC060|nr:hypothetical protein [Alkalihalobacillus sp. AL-G]WLD94165.1 hypothetical protein MOJ78_04525 [Alkalihalobacillus sp. AL-G]
MIESQRLLVQLTMLREATLHESAVDFFVGFDDDENPYLFLPTSPGVLPENQLYAVPVLMRRKEATLFLLDDTILTVNIENFHEFHSDLTYYFGPEHNMLKKYIRSTEYRSYVLWSNGMLRDQIDELLDSYAKAESEDKKRTIRMQLSRFRAINK